jgi:hypothetical protein
MGRPGKGTRELFEDGHTHLLSATMCRSFPQILPSLEPVLTPGKSANRIRSFLELCLSGNAVEQELRGYGLWKEGLYIDVKRLDMLYYAVK